MSDNIKEFKKKIAAPKDEMNGFVPFACATCGSMHFKQIYLMMRKSAILSDHGHEEFAPIQSFACETCGWVIGSPIDQEAKDIFEKMKVGQKDEFAKIQNEINGASITIE